MQKAHKSTHFKAKLIHADVKRWERRGGDLSAEHVAFALEAGASDALEGAKTGIPLVAKDYSNGQSFAYHK